MSAKPEGTTNKSSLTRVTSVEDQLLDLVRREIAAATSNDEAAAVVPFQEAPPAAVASSAESSPSLVPSTQQPDSTKTIEAIDRLIGELQETRDYLQKEADRIARASARYAQMSEAASASVEIISETVRRWRKGG